MSIRVKSTQPGEYPTGHYRDVGKIFDVKDEKHFHDSWMIKVDGAGKPIVAAKAAAPTVAGKPGKGKAKGAKTEPVEPVDDAEIPEDEEEAEPSDAESETTGGESVI
jgi:hypothetical protein